MLGLEPVSLVVNKSVSRGCRIARCCNIASDMLSVLVEQEVEMLELASKSRQRECVGFEMVWEPGRAFQADGLTRILCKKG